MNEIYTDLERNEVSAMQKIVDHGNLERTMLKVVEETTELNEVLIKMVTKREDLKPPIDKVIEEMGDVLFRIAVLAKKMDIEGEVEDRFNEKMAQVIRWINEQKI